MSLEKYRVTSTINLKDIPTKEVDDKPTARNILAKILLQELEKYNFTEPTLSDKLIAQLDDFKAELNNE